MHEWMQKLLVLQEKDVRIAQIEAQLKSVPAEKKRAADEVKAEEAAVAVAREAMITAEKAIKVFEIEIEQIRTRMRDFQSKSAMIKNNEEYRAALHQIETCKRLIAEQEEGELGKMEDLERARGVLAAEQKKVAAARARADELTADLDRRAAGCKQELAKMAQERAALLPGIDAEALRRYDRIRVARQASADIRAFVPVRAGVCGGCHMNVPPQVRVNAAKGQVAACQNCGRLLYAED
jgi:hypothetical protein